jgi:hypothetical protein
MVVGSTTALLIWTALFDWPDSVPEHAASPLGAPKA